MTALLLLGTLASAQEPERKAVRFLSREIPRWARDNHCYSCHNNGDAARALYEARKRDYEVPREALADTNAWLARPESWDKNGGEGPFSDKVLARVQFAWALASAIDTGALEDAKPLAKAAAMLAGDQAAEGFWPVEDGGALGSPASYGRPLATLAAIETLRAADPVRYQKSIRRAQAWLRSRKRAGTLDLAISLILPAEAGDDVAKSISRLASSQTEEGGWGPYADSAPEPFDTAVAVLALVKHGPKPDTTAMLHRARAYLISAQSKDGGWPETTRPSGAQSYAQRISTTGWATLALLATRGLDRKR